MSYNLKEHIAECCRRADEYKLLHDRASSSGEREAFFSTTLRFLRLAENLAKSNRVLSLRRAARSRRSGVVR